MRRYYHLLLQCICFLAFISNAYSQDIRHIVPQMQPINSIFSTAPQDPQVNKIITELLIKHSNDQSSYDSLNVLMNKQAQRQAEEITELQNNINALQSDKKLQLNLSNRLKSLTKQNIGMNADSNINDADKIEMNFLDLRLIDAYFMLEAVRKSPQITLELVQHMNELAVDAADGTHSTAEMQALDLKFQAYKRAINFVQTITLLNGHKVINGGDIIIKFGANATEASSLRINVPAFDAKSLLINDLAIQTQADATAAIGTIQVSIQKLVKCIAITAGTPVINDAEAMILSIPFMLYQNFELLMTTRDLILEAMNGTVSDDDRALMNIDFDYLKSAMNKTQTYLSLSGPKMIGGGNIMIQIGNESSPYTTLKIDLPATDIKKIGMDNQNIKTFASTKEAFVAILKNMYDFTYSPASNSKTH